MHVRSAHVSGEEKKTWRTMKMMTRLLQRLVNITAVKFLKNLQREQCNEEYIFLVPLQVDVYLAQTLADKLFLFQVILIWCYLKLKACGRF